MWHFVFLVSFCGVFGANGLPVQEMDALYDLYQSTNGRNWRWGDSGIPWDFNNQNSDPCVDNWDGVECYPGNAHVSELILSMHRMHGKVPDSISNLTFLNYLDLANNRLTGSLSSTVGEFLLLREIYLNVNEMNGTIPASVGKLQLLAQFSLYLNKFSGTLPSSMGNMTSLVGMGIYNNLFTGTIPDSFGNLQNMAGLRIYNNLLRGPIPNTLRGCISMKYVELFNNSFTGTIPANFGDISNMEELLLHDNLLTGTIPSTLSTLEHLTVMMLHNNKLTGNLDALFNASVQNILATIQVSNNQLTGTLSSAVFALPALLTFDAVSNCFQGTLPENICTPQLLNTLALDGLSSAKSCQSALLPSLSQSYVVQNPVKGSIPDCIFSLPQLQTLHLSGNGFTGSLPQDILLGAHLSDLSLSHNQLTGSIPTAVQKRQWYSLDLSFNYVSGSLLSDFAPQKARVYRNYTLPGTSLSLENNRLSGPIPKAVTNAPEVSVLKGNLFNCSADRSDLPSTDSNRDNYQCGSEALDVVYYAWLGLTSLAAFLLLFLYHGMRGTTQCLPHFWAESATTLQKWYTASGGSSAEVAQAGVAHSGVRAVHLHNVLCLYSAIVKLCAVIAVVIVIVFLPLYGLLKLQYGTHEHQYAWVVSAAYETGTITTALELVALFLLLAGILALARWARSRDAANSLYAQPVPVLLVDTTKNDLRSRGVLLVYVMLNGIVVGGVNVAFVYIALRESSTALLISQIAIALFKMCWNHVSTSGMMIRWLTRFLDSSATSDCAAYRTDHATLLMLGVALFNTLAIPCLVVLAISPDCFYNVFVAAPAVEASYIILKCSTAENGVCLSYEPYPQTTSYHPPFTYSYQCSSSFVTYYAPAFVYLCMMATFGSPLYYLTLKWLHGAFPQGSYAFQIVDALLPRLLKSFLAPAIPQGSQYLGSGKQAEEGCVNPIVSVELGSQPTNDRETSTAGINVALADQHFNASRLLLSFITYLGLLLTFGVAYPPLAPCIVLAVGAILLYIRLAIGRLLLSTPQEPQMDANIVNIVNDACCSVGSTEFVKAATWMVITFSSGFYTLFLFDALGDEVGLLGAYWVLILVPAFPLILFLCMKLLYIIWSVTLAKTTISQENEVGVEIK